MSLKSALESACLLNCWNGRTLTGFFVRSSRKASVSLHFCKNRCFQADQNIFFDDSYYRWFLLSIFSFQDGYPRYGDVDHNQDEVDLNIDDAQSKLNRQNMCQTTWVKDRGKFYIYENIYSGHNFLLNCVDSVSYISKWPLL